MIYDNIWYLLYNNYMVSIFKFDINWIQTLNHVQTKFPTKSEKKYDSDCCVKGRYEPMHIIQVAEVIAGVKGISVEEVATASRNNAHKLFGKLTKEFI